jgi:RNAse (barnase) inhibitor barstar
METTIMKYKATLLLSVVIFSTQIYSSTNVIIDGKKIKNRNEMQIQLEKQLEMHRNSGKEIETVYETLLSDFKTESVIRIKHLESLRAKLGEQYVQDFIEMVSRASEDNLHVVLIIE